jgi:DHA2 family multidrug resistance protein
VLGFVLYGSIVILPIWLQTLMGYPATRAGLTMAPRGLGSMIAMPLIGIILPHFDARKLLAGGLLLGAFSTWQFAQMNLNAGYWDLFWPQFTQGFGLGLIFVPLTTISMGKVPRESMGNATSLFNLMRNIGGAVGIAVIAMLNTRYQQKYINILGSHVAQGDPATGQWLGSLRSMFLGTGSGAGSGPGSAEQRAYGAMFGLVQQQAAMRAFLDIFTLVTVMFLLMIPLLLLMRKPKKD